LNPIKAAITRFELRASTVGDKRHITLAEFSGAYVAYVAAYTLQVAQAGHKRPFAAV
jgi:hypothetical protein